MFLSNYRGVALSFIAAATLAACSSQSGNSLVPAQNAFGVQGSHTVESVDASPEACVGQKTTAKYASLATQFTTKGGSVCIPAFGGFGGSVAYPGAKPAVKITLTSSTTNYNKMPYLQKTGKPIFYLQVAFSGGTLFAKTVGIGGGVIGKSFVAGKTYTVIAGASVLGFTKVLGSCYAVATKNSPGGQISGFGNLLKGQTIAEALTGVLEVYSGKTAKTKC